MSQVRADELVNAAGTGPPSFPHGLTLLPSTIGALAAASNLSDLGNAATARSNLGVGEWSQNLLYLPTAHSAMGDGATDDRAALNTLVNTTIPATGGTAVIDRTYRIGSSMTIPATVALDVRTGGKFIIDSGAVVTILGSINAGHYRLFTGAGTVVLQGPGEAKVAWFGDIATDIGAAINACFTATKNRETLMLLPAGRYPCLSHIVLNCTSDNGINLRGAGPWSTILNCTGMTAGAALTIGGVQGPQALIDFAIEHAPGVGFAIDNGGIGSEYNIRAYQCGDWGITMSDSYGTHVRSFFQHESAKGIQITQCNANHFDSITSRFSTGMALEIVATKGASFGLLYLESNYAECLRTYNCSALSIEAIYLENNNINNAALYEICINDTALGASGSSGTTIQAIYATTPAHPVPTIHIGTAAATTICGLDCSPGTQAAVELIAAVTNVPLTFRGCNFSNRTVDLSNAAAPGTNRGAILFDSCRGGATITLPANVPVDFIGCDGDMARVLERAIVAASTVAIPIDHNDRMVTVDASGAGGTALIGLPNVSYQLGEHTFTIIKSDASANAVNASGGPTYVMATQYAMVVLRYSYQLGRWLQMN